MIRAFAVLFLLAVPAAAEWPCVAPPSTQKPLASLPRADDFRFNMDQRIAARWRLVQQRPADLFILLDHQNAIRRRLFLGEEWDRALAFYRSKPSDPAMRFLEARLSMAFDGKTARENFLALIREFPDFPWPHLALVEFHEMPGRTDRTASEKHMSAFLNRCPGALEAYVHFRDIQSEELIREAAAKLREQLDRRSDPDVVGHYGPLWDLESRAAGAGALAEVQARIRQDVERLQGIGGEPGIGWLWTFRKASELTGDPAFTDWVENRIVAAAPGSPAAIAAARSRWRRENPPPGRTAPQDEWQAYRRKEAMFDAELRKKYPDSAELLHSRQIGALFDKTMPDSEWLEAIDEYEALRKASPDLAFSVPPFPIVLAEVYLERNMRIERIPRLVEEGLALAETSNRYQPDMSALPQRGRQLIDGLGDAHRRADLVLASYHTRRKEFDKAHALLGRVEAGEPGSGASRHFLLMRRVELAVAEGKKEEALEMYREAVARFGKEQAANMANPTVAAAKRLYLETGRDEAKWAEWITLAPARPKPEPRRLAFRDPMPEFDLRDQAGKKWTLACLKGKVTLINVWATWCGPCRYEHLEIQALYERIKHRKDIQLLTLSIDENPTLIAPYMSKMGYTFPVLAARELADRAFGIVSVPQNWLVDVEGRRSDLMVHPRSKDFAAGMIARMEESR